MDEDIKVRVKADAPNPLYVGLCGFHISKGETKMCPVDVYNGLKQVLDRVKEEETIDAEDVGDLEKELQLKKDEDILKEQDERTEEISAAPEPETEPEPDKKDIVSKVSHGTKKNKKKRYR